jgi:ubiquinone/menaquinone biosynthesis C-methylase UbiE
MTTKLDRTAADRALKAEHAAMWASGNYSVFASDVIVELGPTLVKACGVGSGDHVLDVAAGTGNAAIPAALKGAKVVACDLTPELLEVGRARAAQRGVGIEWQQADAEALPYPDDDFDTVMSSVGVMFAPHHRESSRELIRVCRPGGTIGVISWTPDGLIGRLFSIMERYAPTPADAQWPLLWGSEDHVRSLFGERVTDVAAHPRMLTIKNFETATAFRDFFRDNYGPTVATYRAIAGDPDRVATLDRDLIELAKSHDLGNGTMDWEYLLFTARKR